MTVIFTANEKPAKRQVFLCENRDCEFAVDYEGHGVHDGGYERACHDGRVQFEFFGDKRQHAADEFRNEHRQKQRH